MDRQESAKLSSMSMLDLPNSMSYSKKAITDLNNDLVSAINMAGKENKGQIAKLT